MTPILAYKSHPEFQTYIPEAIITKTDANSDFAILSRDTNTPLSYSEVEALLNSGFISATILSYSEGKWPVVEYGFAMVINIEEIGRWKDKKATELVQRASEYIKTDPIKSINFCENATYLHGFELAKFIQEIKSQASGETDLLKAFDKVRNNLREDRKS